MNEACPHMPRVAVLPWPGIENAYLCLSGGWRDEEKEFTKARISFLYDHHGKCCTEWDGEYGPISIWHKREEGWESDSMKAQPHWFFAHASSDWSQLAVDDEHLVEKFLSGDYDGIFESLKTWAESNA